MVEGDILENAKLVESLERTGASARSVAESLQESARLQDAIDEQRAVSTLAGLRTGGVVWIVGLPVDRRGRVGVFHAHVGYEEDRVGGPVPYLWCLNLGYFCRPMYRFSLNEFIEIFEASLGGEFQEVFDRPG